MVVEMVVKIGTVELPNVLNWEEEEVSSVPVKRVIRKTTPTVQAQYFTREPRKIVITTRLTTAERTDLRALKNLFQWQELYDYDDSFVDYVWIEKLGVRWARAEFKDTPWVYMIDLICSQT